MYLLFILLQRTAVVTEEKWRVGVLGLEDDTTNGSIKT